jgi:hypothetical protein
VSSICLYWQKDCPRNVRLVRGRRLECLRTHVVPSKSLRSISHRRIPDIAAQTTGIYEYSNIHKSVDLVATSQKIGFVEATVEKKNTSSYAIYTTTHQPSPNPAAFLLTLPRPAHNSKMTPTCPKQLRCGATQLPIVTLVTQKDGLTVFGHGATIVILRRKR